MQKKEMIVVGVHAASVALQYHPENILTFYIEQDLLKKGHALLAQCEAVGIQPLGAKSATLDKLANGVSHQGVVLKIKYTAMGESDLLATLAELSTPPLILVLDGVHDPHNLGACLRSAESFGATAVVVPSHEAVSLTPAVSKAACGAEQLIPLIQVSNLSRFIKELKDNQVWVAGFAATATQSIAQLDAKVPLALIMGQEGRGLRRLTEEACDWLVKIPMQGKTASLNLSASASIALYEVARQRNT